MNPYTPGTDQHRAWTKGYDAADSKWRMTVEAVRQAKERPAFRSAETGRWVTRLFAFLNPKSTVAEK